jgi:hypothetical protein
LLHGGWRLTRLTVGDIALVAAIAVVGVLLLVLADRDAETGSRVVMRALGGETHIFDLGRPQTVNIEGLLGVTKIVIKGGSVQFVDSPCPHGLCVRRGAISRVGDMIACLPNGVVATIEGESDYDGITP